VTLFTSSGFTSLREFSELDETDLDQLHVVQSEDRAKLLTAAQLLHDYENEGFTSANTQCYTRIMTHTCTTLTHNDMMISVCE